MLKPARDPREGKTIRCEALECNSFTKWNSEAWTKLWCMVWIEQAGTSFSACSQHCVNEIKAGRYQIRNEQPKPTTAKMKAEQMKMF